MKSFKRFLTLALAMMLLLGICLPALSNRAEAAGFSGVKGPTLIKSGGSWYYVKNGKVCNATTLVKYNGSWWYVVNGKVASNTTSLVKYNNEWWYVVNGKVASGTTSLVKYNGEWWYVVKGKLAAKTTSLVKYNGEWWYVVKGKIAAKTTTLVKYNGSWYYIVKGKLASNTTTLVNYKGGWYYVNCGKVDNTATTMVSRNGKWFYVNKGKVDTNALKVSTRSNTEYRYDTKGRLSREVISDNYYGSSTTTKYYHYNSAGNISWIKTQFDSRYYTYADYYYNQNKTLSRIEYETDDGEWDGEIIYTYYSDGSYQKEEKDREGGGIKRYNKNGQMTYSDYGCAECEDRYYYQYNRYGDISSVKHVADSEWDVEYIGTDYTTYQYVYNTQKKPISCITYCQDAETSATYYTYNTQGLVTRKLQFSEDCIYLTVYTYDKNGNCLTETLYDVLTNRTLR